MNSIFVGNTQPRSPFSSAQTPRHISQTQHFDPQKSSRCHLIEALRLARETQSETSGGARDQVARPPPPGLKQCFNDLCTCFKTYS